MQQGGGDSCGLVGVVGWRGAGLGGGMSGFIIFNETRGFAFVQTSLLEIQRAKECVFILNDFRKEECANFLKPSLGDFLSLRVRFNSEGDIVFLLFASSLGEAHSSLSEKFNSFLAVRSEGEFAPGDNSLMGAKLGVFFILEKVEFKVLGEGKGVSDKRFPTLSKELLLVCVSSL